MGADDVQAPLRKYETNLDTPLPRKPPPPGGGPLEKFGMRPGHAFILGGEPLENFGSPGRMDTDQGRAPLLKGNHSNPSPHDTPPRGGPIDFFPRPRHEFSHRGEPLPKFWPQGAGKLNPSPANGLHQGGGTPTYPQGGGIWVYLSTPLLRLNPPSTSMVFVPAEAAA